MLFNRQSFYISWRKDHQKDSFLELILHGLCREEEPTHSSALDPTPARLEDSRDSPQGSRERKSTVDLTHARMLQLQELGLAARVTNTLDNEGQSQGFAEVSKSEAWMDLMRKNLSSLIDNQTWTLVDLPPGRRQYALVAKGHPQKPGIDYNGTFAPVGYKVILRFVLSFALHLGYELFQLDIDIAYLYGNLKETIYMIQPECVVI